MAKETYYFSHDYNASEDFKCLFLRQQLGMEGYGIYWFLIEKLANAGGYLPVSLCPVLATQMQVSEVKVSGVIRSFDLFKTTEELFFSERLCEHLQNRRSLSQKNSLNGKISAAKRLISSSFPTSVEESLDDGSTVVQQRKGKERKGKERKVKYKGNILLFEEENEKLIQLYGKPTTLLAYEYLSSYKIEKGYTTKSDYLTILRWVIDAVQKNKKMVPEKPLSKYEQELKEKRDNFRNSTIKE
jgi:hypothetical protein